MKCHPAFLRDAKSLRKRLPSIDKDVAAHCRLLDAGIPTAIGDEIPGQFGEQHVFKARVICQDSTFSKSSSYRLVYLYIETGTKRVLLHIYVHSKQGGGRGEQDMLSEVKKRLRSLDLDDLSEFGAMGDESQEATT